MSEIQGVLMFCLFYSGVVMYALWITVARTPQRVEAKVRERQ